MNPTEWGIIAPTSIYSCQRTVGDHSLPPIPRPRKVGFGRTNRTKSLQANWQARFLINRIKPAKAHSRGLTSPTLPIVCQALGR